MPEFASIMPSDKVQNVKKEIMVSNLLTTLKLSGLNVRVDW